MIKTFLYFLVSVLLISSNNQEECLCNDLKEGKFESYEGDKKIGVFYRKGKFQLEKGLKNNKYSVAIIKSDNCVFLMNSYRIENSIDTITWSINYKKSSENRYSFTMKPSYLETKYSLKGYVVKVSDEIDDEEALIRFKKLGNGSD